VSANGTPLLGDPAKANDTVAVPVTGQITLENRDALVEAAAAQVSAQLEKWGYEPVETTTYIDPTTGEEITVPVPQTDSPTASQQPATSGGTNPPNTAGTSTATRTNPPSQKPTTPSTASTTKKPETSKPAAKYPETMRKTEVNYVIPQDVDRFSETFSYDRFTDSPSFAITNNQGKELIVRLRPADPNKPRDSYADIYTDRNGDGTWEWQTAMKCPVSYASSEGGAYEGRTSIMTDSNYFGNFGGDSGPHAMPMISIYWMKEHGAAIITGGGGHTVDRSYSEYRRLQNAGSGVHIVQGVDGVTTAAYYK
jgi:hypothetical protein